MMEAVQRALPHMQVVDAPLAWDSSRPEFLNSVMRMISQAHRGSSLYLAIRTAENTNHFGILHALSGEQENVTEQLVGRGCVICDPTEAIAYHKDNMVKLPTSMTLPQAIRKISDMVENGVEAQCQICLEMTGGSEPTVFMPCVCMVPIHKMCLLTIYDSGCSVCPVCRSGFNNLDVR